MPDDPRGTLSYALTGPGGGPLPSGMSFAPDTRTASLCPCSFVGTVTLTYTVTDTVGGDIVSVVRALFDVTVLGLVPSTPDDQSWPAGVAIDPVVLPAAMNTDLEDQGRSRGGLHADRAG